MLLLVYIVSTNLEDCSALKQWFSKWELQGGGA